MSKLINFFKNKWVIQAIGITALCLLIWFVGPLIAIADSVPLATFLARSMVLLIVMVLWLLNIVRIQLKTNRANTSMVNDLTQQETLGNEADLNTNQEVDELKNNFDSALQLLKKSTSKSSQGQHVLYDLPWYIIIGPSGSGKTTALINSGLEFPLAERFGKNAVQGVGGTRNCDWWFTDQAVMLDTAGRYTTQDSHEQVDKSAWFGFLQLLKKHRPRRPLNGVLIAMSVSDLLRLTEEERNLHARAIRQRIEELTEQLGIRIPIYMLFTKTDMIAGFTDFFADLGQEERAQVWGMTFPEQSESTDYIGQINTEYDDLLSRINQRLNDRLQNERDLNRRNLVFGFPQRLSMLKQPLMQFLEASFAVNRYQSAPMLRGVYLTSGTQEGTPIDRLMGVLANTFKLGRNITPMFSGKGRSYFITRLLKEVIFPESELVGLNQKLERRRSLLQQIAYASVILITLICAGLWANSYRLNKQSLQQLSEKTAVYNALVQQGKLNKIDFAALLQRMDALQAVRDVYPVQDIPWAMRLGLYQGKALRGLAEANYQKLLINHFLPMIKHRLEQRMIGEESNNVEILYQLLRVYLMLANPDKVDTAIISSWVKVDWDNQMTTETSQQLTEHLGALLAVKLPVQTLDDNLIREVRQILTQVPIAQQVYMRIKADALQNHDKDFSLASELGLSGERVFTSDSGSLETLIIPGLFTYKGFHEVFLNESKDLAKQTVEQRWVLGADSLAGAKDLNELETKLFKYYYAEYIKRWDTLLQSLRVRKPTNLNQAVEILEIVSGYDSPLRSLLQAVGRETSLTRVAAVNEGNVVDKLKEGASEIRVSSRMQKLLNTAKSASGDSLVVDRSGKDVEDHFARLSEQVNKGSGGSAPIDQVINDLSALYGSMADLASTSDSGAAAVDMAKQGTGGGEVIAKIQRQSARLPEPVKEIVEALASGNQGLIMGGVRNQLNNTLQTDVSSLCKVSIDGRYPIIKNSRSSITLQDFGRFFAPQGLFDQFFDTNLRPFVDTTRSQWRVISQNNQRVGISLSTLKQFQNAAKIRDVFFQDGGQLPKVQFELKPLYLDDKASRFWLDLEGQLNSYRHGPTRSMRFVWPGTRPGLVRYGFETLDGKQVSGSEEGDWSWFRLLDKMQVSKLAANTYQVTFELNGLTAKYELKATSVINPFAFTELSTFQCPSRI